MNMCREIQIFLNKSIVQNFDEGIRREWLETNGLGGWASSTITGAHSRRYHGLLVAATCPPVGRIVLLSKLDETIRMAGNCFELGCHVFPGTICPKGFEFLTGFTKELFPVFDYEVSGIRIRKTIIVPNQENTTIIVYEILSSPSSFALQWKPLVAGRDYHHLVQANEVIRREASFQNSTFHVRPYYDIPDLFIYIPGAHYEARPDWYYHFEYLEEKKRGMDFREDLFCYGLFTRTMNPGDKLAVIISTQNPSGRDALKLYEQEKNRRLGLLEKLPCQDSISKMLALAADQFLVRRGKGLRTIIAGYHWFTDWGRDTMIALPGITLVTGRFQDAQKILQAFAGHVSQGMLPNRFPDKSEGAEYNTADATLWFFVAIYKYLQYTGNEKFVKNTLMPVLEEIIQWHDRGTRYHIHIDEDGLLYAGEPGIQLTWMDAKIGGWVVTPRQGKTVEINALWYNALKIMAHISRRFHKNRSAMAYEKKARQVKKTFISLFWNKELQCLYDCVAGDHRDTSVRPNQILALSLPFPILAKDMAKSVLHTVEKALFTPFGLRSLDPRHPDYCPRYEGDRLARDSAYHQGTVWGWLMGPYITALIRVKGIAGQKQAERILKHLTTHFREAGIGTISEIFDAESPHTARGCIAQAWSVSEILRAYVEDIVPSCYDDESSHRAKK